MQESYCQMWMWQNLHHVCLPQGSIIMAKHALRLSAYMYMSHSMRKCCSALVEQAASVVVGNGMQESSQLGTTAKRETVEYCKVFVPMRLRKITLVYFAVVRKLKARVISLSRL